MIQVLSLLVVLVISMIVTRVATSALVITGLARPVARFQARSALTGAGFTTTESERIVNHPLRRRIIMLLMLLGNSGLVIMASLLIVIVGADRGEITMWHYGGLALGLAVLWFIATSRWIDRWLSVHIERLLARYTDLDTCDYAGLLRLQGDYQIVELAVEEQDWLAGRELAKLQLSHEGVLVLGVTRADGTFVGAPRGKTTIEHGDTLLVYGRSGVIQRIDERRAGIGGHLGHLEAVAQQRKAEQDEAAQEATQRKEPERSEE